MNLVENELNKFQVLHNEILYNGKLACQFAIEMAYKLKEMRDSKLYLTGGYSSFSEYVESGVGIKERQAYNYIKVYEDLPEDFLHLNAKIGITKLTLLTTLSNEERDIIFENNNINDLSVLELKKQIEDLKSKNVSLEDNFKKLSDVQRNFSKKNSKLHKENALLKDEINKLKESSKEIVTVVDKSLNEKINELEQQLYEKEILLNEEIIKNQVLNKKLILNDESLLLFKAKFNDLQLIGNDLIKLLNNIPNDKKSKFKQAILSVVESWKLND